MRYDFLIVSLLFSIASVLVVFALYIFTKKQAIIGMKILALYALANFIFLVGEASVILSDSEASILMFSHIQMIGYSFIPTLWCLLSIAQKRNGREFLKPKYILLMHLPLIFFISMILYPWEGYTSNLSWIQTLYYQDHILVYGLSLGSGFVGLQFTKGILLYVTEAYFSLLMLFSAWNFWTKWKASRVHDANRMLLLVAASLILFFVFIVGFFFTKTALIDVGTFITSLMVVLAFFSLYKYEMIDLTPAAYREAYFDSAFPIIILNRGRQVVSANQEAQRLYEGMIDFRNVIGFEEFDRFDPEFTNDLTKHTEHEAVFEKNGETFYYLVKFKPLNGTHRFLGFLITYRDITSHKKELHQLEYMAMYDDLTKIFNRRVFYNNALEQFEESVIHRRNISFVMFDLDDFKGINDIYGHLAGDFVLSELASLVKSELSAEMIFARYGGEEFILCFPGMSPTLAYEKAEAIRKKLSSHSFVYQHHKMKVTASFGVSGSKDSISKSFETFLKEADDALYMAKGAGKNQVIIFE